MDGALIAAGDVGTGAPLPRQHGRHGPGLPVADGSYPSDDDPAALRLEYGARSQGGHVSRARGPSATPSRQVVRSIWSVSVSRTQCLSDEAARMPGFDAANQGHREWHLLNLEMLTIFAAHRSSSELEVYLKLVAVATGIVELVERLSFGGVLRHMQDAACTMIPSLAENLRQVRRASRTNIPQLISAGLLALPIHAATASRRTATTPAALHNPCGRNEARRAVRVCCPIFAAHDAVALDARRPVHPHG